MSAASLRWLVFGASGAVGRHVLERLRAAGARAVAVSRQQHPSDDTVQWLRGDLQSLAAPDAVDLIASLGPLDHFAAWLERVAPVPPRRVVALSSTSVHSKRDSADRAEADLAHRLAEAEAGLATWCRSRGCAFTLLRPTLIYDGVEQLALARIAGVARRLRFFPLPRWSTGRRMPVHADDVAAAALAAALAPAAANASYDLPGGEVLSYREMVVRTLAAMPESPRLVTVPAWLARPLFGLVARLGWMPGASAAVLARTAQDLVFDAGPAARDFGYSPRVFSPAAPSARAGR